MGAPSRIHEMLERAFCQRSGTLSDGTALLSLAHCLGRWDLHTVRDLRRLTEPQAREALRILKVIDPPCDPAIPLRLVANRSR